MSNESTAMVQMEESFTSLSIGRPPNQVLAEAVQAANALKEIISRKPKKVIFNGETYIENEDWITCARFYGVTSRIKTTTYVEFGSVRGFEATAEAYLVSTGQVIGTADAMCLNDEENWGMRPKYEWKDELDKDGKKIWLENKKTGKKYPKGEKVLVGSTPVPLFQLRSMAQTRASSKVLSMIFKWVVVLAGFKPTPAEEVDQTTVDAAPENESQETQGVKRPERKKSDKTIEEMSVKKDEAPKEAAKDAPKEEAKTEDKPSAVKLISEKQQKMLYAVSKQRKLSDQEIKDKLKAEFGVEHSRDLPADRFQAYLDSVDPDFEFHYAAKDKDNF